MKIHDVEQGTPEWFALRAGIPTASEFANLVTPNWKIRTGEMVESYLSRKLAERWRRSPLAGWSSGPMEQGSLREDEAIPYFEVRTGKQVKRIGFVTTDDGRWGCSPDGLLADGTGIEVKCPEPQTQVKYLLSGEIPAQYAAQVQGSMLVTGAASWTFFSFCRGFPALMLTVERNASAIDALVKALESFCDHLDDAYSELVHLYGGEPDKDADLPGALGF